MSGEGAIGGRGSAARLLARAGLGDAVLDLRKRLGLQIPKTGKVRFGDLRRLTPLSASAGRERGLPIARYYGEAFLLEQSAAIGGRVLHEGSLAVSRFARRDAEIISASNRSEFDLFDCVVAEDRLGVCAEPTLGLRELLDVTRPGGTLLLIENVGGGNRGDLRRLMTERGVAALVREHFPEIRLEVRVYGNVLSLSACLHGLAAEDLSARELDGTDPRYPVVLAACLEKPPTP